MHTGIGWTLIPVCIRGFLHPCMHTGIFQSLPVCIMKLCAYGKSSFVSPYAWFCVWGSPFAYGDSRMQTVGDRWKICIWGSVTANIGWYVVPILHDQPSCNIDITWPVESTLWVKFVLISVQICVLPFSCRYYMIGVSCNIDSTWSCSM